MTYFRVNTMKYSFRSLLSYSRLPGRSGGRSLLLSGNLDAIPAAVAGFLIIQALARHGGIGVSPDSVVYISTAANIHDHGLIDDFTNMPVMDFPALYPIFLSGIQFLTGQSILSAGPILNGLLFATLIWLSGWLMEHFSFPSKWYKWTLLLFIVFSPCLLEVYSMIWSETLFILLSLLFIIACHRYFRTHSTGALMTAGLIAGLACVTRYAGVSLIGMGGLLMLCDGCLPFRKATVRKKIGHMLLFGLVALAPLALNLYRNHRLTGTMTGYREKGLTSLSENLHDFGSVFCDWLPFFNERYGSATLIGILFILGITAFFVFRLVRRKDFFSYDTIAISYFIVYTGFILFSATVSRFQELDSRLLSPLFLPWLWGSTCWIPAWLGRSRQHLNSPDNGSLVRPSAPLSGSAPRRPAPIPWRLASIAIVIAAAACFGWGEWTEWRLNWNGIRFAGIPGYTEDQWRKSATMDYVRNNSAVLQANGTIYSNAFEGLWFLAGIRSELIPHKEIPEDIRYMMIEKKFTVIWFDDSENDDLIDIDYIKKNKQLVSEQHFNDGAIYFFATEPSGAGR
jgi:hypothetical protein